MNIMLGNLSTMDICNRLGISLPSDVVETLESIRSHKAEFTGDYWHGFDIPFIIYCGNINVAIKIRDIYKPYIKEMKTQLSMSQSPQTGQVYFNAERFHACLCS